MIARGDPPEAGARSDSEGEGKLPDELGRWASEKRRVFQRLKDYRERCGLGSFAKLESAANGAITAELIRAIYIGDVKGTMTQWKLIDAAISYIERQDSD